MWRELITLFPQLLIGHLGISTLSTAVKPRRVVPPVHPLPRFPQSLSALPTVTFFSSQALGVAIQGNIKCGSRMVRDHFCKFRWMTKYTGGMTPARQALSRWDLCRFTPHRLSWEGGHQCTPGSGAYVFG